MTKAKDPSITFACVPCCYDENGCDASHALVTLTKHCVEELLKRIDMMKALKAFMPHLHCLEEFDYSVEYIDIGLLVDSPEYHGQLKDVNDSWCALENDVPVKDDEMIRIEVPVLVVYEDGVRWDACLKHTSIRVSTTRFDRKQLEEILRDLTGMQGGK